MIHWELCKRLKFDYTDKWYEYKLESKNETNKILRDFEILTDHLISARQPDQVSINEKKRHYQLDLAVLADHRIKMKGSKKDYLDLVRQLKMLWKGESICLTNSYLEDETSLKSGIINTRRLVLRSRAKMKFQYTESLSQKTNFEKSILYA